MFAQFLATRILQRLSPTLYLKTNINFMSCLSQKHISKYFLGHLTGEYHSITLIENIFLKNFLIKCRDGFGLGLGKNLHGFPRYKIVGRTEEGKICRFGSMSSTGR